MVGVVEEPPTYYEVLAAFHRVLEPRTYLEIGVHQGHSLSLAHPAARCLGIDPAADIRCDVPRHTTILATTSDEAFASGDVDRFLDGEALDLVFIDGLHLFEQALRDFVNVEARCHPDSVVLVHDCLPIDADTSARDRTTAVWSGDVWKVVAALRAHRRDLTVVTIDASPTGLGLVTGLDSSSTRLDDDFDEIVASLVPLGYDDLVAQGADLALGVTPIGRPLRRSVAELVRR